MFSLLSFCRRIQNVVLVASNTLMHYALYVCIVYEKYWINSSKTVIGVGTKYANTIIQEKCLSSNRCHFVKTILETNSFM